MANNVIKFPGTDEFITVLACPECNNTYLLVCPNKDGTHSHICEECDIIVGLPPIEDNQVIFTPD